MTKAFILEHYGAEWYERHKANCRKRSHDFYVENREQELERTSRYHMEHPASRKRTAKKHAEIYRIQCRDRQRLITMGLVSEGQEVHHMKYHKDNKDASWIDDVIVMSREEHSKWHMENPDFDSLSNVV